jgi:hypothetical protein
MQDDATEGMVTLTERMVHLIGQLGMPVVEVAVVLRRRIDALLTPLLAWAASTKTSLSEEVLHPWPLVTVAGNQADATFDLERLMQHVDADRMDILDTLIRATLAEVNLDLIHGVLALRPWEQVARQQLAEADGPGRLFSPLEIPEDF